MSAALPIGLVAAAAVICIVIAVVTSARHADEVAVKHDEELLVNAIAEYRERVLREVESVATTDQAVKNIRTAADADWIERNVASTLKDHFNQDYVIVLDGNDRVIYPVAGSRSVDPAWFDTI